MRRDLILLAILAFAAPLAVHAETPQELWKSGYKIIWESPYEDIEECTPDKGIVLSNGNIFICDGYEYVYHYGGVFLVARSLTIGERSVTSIYLCLEDEDQCLSGTLVRR